MVTLNISPKELLDLLKCNVKLPEFLRDMTCKYNVLFFIIPRKGQEGVPLDVDFRFADGCFHFKVNSGNLDKITELTVTAQDILDVLAAHKEQIPGFLQTLTYDGDKGRFLFRLQAENIEGEQPPPFQGPIQLAAHLSLPPTDILCLDIKQDAPQE